MFACPVHYRLLIVAAIVLAGALCGISLEPMPQDLAYHDFADKRPLLGISNFADVASNVFFLLVGAYGLQCVRHRGTACESTAYGLFFAGVFATCFGSAYYHLAPSSERLMWDRLPMSVAFMSLLAATLSERIHPRLGRQMLFPLVALGLFSVLLWRWTESVGNGDLRLYYAVQFLTLVLVLLMILLFASPYTRSSELLLGLGLYVIAKVCEANDRALLGLLGISGHTLKHMLAAGSIFFIAHMLATRRQRSGAIPRQRLEFSLPGNAVSGDST